MSVCCDYVLHCNQSLWRGDPGPTTVVTDQGERAQDRKGTGPCKALREQRWRGLAPRLQVSTGGVAEEPGDGAWGMGSGEG